MLAVTGPAETSGLNGSGLGWCAGWCGLNSREDVVAASGGYRGQVGLLDLLRASVGTTTKIFASLFSTLPGLNKADSTHSTFYYFFYFFFVNRLYHTCGHDSPGIAD